MLKKKKEKCQRMGKRRTLDIANMHMRTNGPQINAQIKRLPSQSADEDAVPWSKDAAQSNTWAMTRDFNK